VRRWLYFLPQFFPVVSTVWRLDGKTRCTDRSMASGAVAPGDLHPCSVVPEPLGTRIWIPRALIGRAVMIGAIWIVLVSACRQGLALAAEAPCSGPDTPATVLEEPPAPFYPRHARSEVEEDRIEALALFAAARTFEQREAYQDALRLYERAVRYDPQSPVLYAAVIRLATRLRRYDEAVRYALIAPGGLKVDPLLLRRLGVYLTRIGRLEDAVRLYRQTIAAKGTDGDAADVLLRMEMGRLCHLVGRYREAAEAFELVVHALEHADEYGIDEQVRRTLLDEPASTWRLMGECFLRSGKLRAAREAFLEASRAASSPGVLEYDLARVLAREGKHKEAFDSLWTAFDAGLTGEGTGPFELLDELLKHLGRSDDLLPTLEDLYARNARNVRLGLYLAGRYLDAGQEDRAAALYWQILEQSADHLPSGEPRLVEQSWRNLVMLQLDGPPEALLATLARVVKNEGSLETLGPALQQLCRDEEKLARVLNSALAHLDSGASEADTERLLAGALLALEAERFEPAGKLLEKTIERQPDKAPALVRLWALRLLAAEREAEAAQVLRRTIEQQAAAARDPLLHYYLAIALALDEQTEAAIQAIDRALELEPDSVQFQARLSWVLYVGKRYDQARRKYEEFIDRYASRYDSPLVRDQLREARLALSNLYVLGDRLAEAEEQLELVLDEFPQDVSASNDLGYLWADQGKHLHRALRLIRQAVKAQPDNPTYRDSLGWVYYRLGRKEAALAELEQAARGQPDPVILDHLAEVQAELGRVDEARRSWQRAREAFIKRGEDDQARAVERKLERLPPEQRSD